jgi:hypothetical protein
MPALDFQRILSYGACFRAMGASFDWRRDFCLILPP